jgi:hypothetical protein
VVHVQVLVCAVCCCSIVLSFCDLMWSDPEDIETWSISPRGAGVYACVCAMCCRIVFLSMWSDIKTWSISPRGAGACVCYVLSLCFSVVSFCDLMWSDPGDIETLSISPRGAVRVWYRVLCAVLSVDLRLDVLDPRT